MSLRLLDIGSLIEFRDNVADLIRLDFSIHEGSGKLLVPPRAEDPVVDLCKSTERGKAEYGGFLVGNVEKAVRRKSPLILKGPLGQSHCFIPAFAGDSGLVLVSGSFFISFDEVKAFGLRKTDYGLTLQDMDVITDRVPVISWERASEVCSNIHKLAGLFVRDAYEKNLNQKRHRRVKTVMDLLSDLGQAVHDEKVYALFSEAILMLFGGDTVAIMTKTDETLIPVHVAGRLKRQIGTLPLRADSMILSEVLGIRKPVICNEAIEILRFGYPEGVATLSLFPVASRDETHGLLAVINADFTAEETETVLRLCMFMGFMVSHIKSLNTYSRHIKDMASLNLAAAELSPSLRDPESLYESIVDISSRLIQAEKVSLMLPEEDRQELLIKAVRGINKWIAKNISVRVGEGIAGKVFKEGKPLIIADVEKQLSTAKRPRYRTGSCMSIPLKLGDETIGVLNLADKVSGDLFSEQDLEFLSYLGAFASLAIKGAHFYNMSEHLRTLSITDPLTGLFNRRYFDDRLFEELQRAGRYDSLFSLAIFDIDDFKLFNDTEGHVAGDEILKTIANISRESVRSIDIVARHGGEEFSIIMPQTDRDEAFLVAERVRENVMNMIPSAWTHYPREKMTVSIGIATFPADGRDGKALLRAADKALFRAKVTGKNKTLLCDPSDRTNDGISLHSNRF